MEGHVDIATSGVEDILICFIISYAMDYIFGQRSIDHLLLLVDCRIESYHLIIGSPCVYLRHVEIKKSFI